jgi:hypothetical protein
MPLLPDQLDDFVALTRPKHTKKNFWQDISLELQNYCFADLIHPDAVNEAATDSINFPLQVANTGTAKNTEMFAPDTTLVKDLAIKGKVVWTKQTVNWSYDVDEPEFQTDDFHTIVGVLHMREHSMWNDFFELMEENLWTAPASSSATPRRPNGIPYYIVKNATTGFNGGAPTGHTTVADINPSTYTKWKNYTALYTDVTRLDFVKKARRASWETKFKPPHQYKELTTGKGKGKNPYGYYTTQSVVEKLEELLDTRNDNLGADLHKYMGAVMIGGNPVHAVAYLEVNDPNVFYGINWKKFSYYTHKNRNTHQYKPHQNADSHTVRNVFMDNWGQFVCTDRRSQFVLDTAT